MTKALEKTIKQLIDELARDGAYSEQERENIQEYLDSLRLNDLQGIEEADLDRYLQGREAFVPGLAPEKRKRYEHWPEIKPLLVDWQDEKTKPDLEARFFALFRENFHLQIKINPRVRDGYTAVLLERTIQTLNGQDKKMDRALRYLSAVLKRLPGRKASAEISKRLEVLQQTVDAIRAHQKADVAPQFRVIPEPVATDGFDLYFENEYTPFRGREQELSELRAFWHAMPQVAWWLVTGAGGMGKSRLALEFCKQLVNEGNEAGFLVYDDTVSYDRWEPTAPTLLVVDYVAQNPSGVGGLIDRLKRREGRLKYDVRVLLLERTEEESWTRDAIRAWDFVAKARYQNELRGPTRVLENLETSWAEHIVQDLMEREGHALLSTAEMARFMDSLGGIDPERRPLFLIASALALAEKGDITGWSREKVLDWLLDRKETKRWGMIPCYKMNPEAVRSLMALATLCRGVQWEEVKEHPMPVADIPPVPYTEYARLISYRKKDAGNAYLGLEPDLLGEYFVLKYLEGCLNDKPLGEERARALLDAAWQIRPEQVWIVLAMMVRDFRENKFIAHFLGTYRPTITSENRIALSYFLNDWLVYREDLFPSAQVPDLWDQVLLINPTLSSAHYNRGVSLAALGRREEAIAAYEKASELNPDDASAHNNRGVSLAALGRREEAIAAFDKASELNPDDASAHNNRGVSLAALGRREEAIAAYEKASELNPDDADPHNNRGVSLAALGRHEEAIAAYEKASELNPDDASAHYNRGISLAALGRREEAIAAFDKASELNPNHASAHNNRGVSLAALGRHEEAIAAFDKASELNPDDADPHNNRGVSLAALGRHEEAIAAYEKASELNPDDASAHYNRGNELRKTGEALPEEASERLVYFQKAANAYGKAWEIAQDLSVLRNRALTYHLYLNEQELALADIELVISLQPENPINYKIQASIYTQLGRMEEAQAATEEAERLEAGGG